jgi:predicted ATPase
MGDRVMGTIMHYAGNQPEARHRYDHYLQRYSAPRLHRHLTWLHYDGPVLVKTRLSRVLWLQGSVDQARLLADQNVRDARALGHPMSECLALGEAACPIASMTGDFEAAQQYLTMLADIATRHSFSFWLSMAKCLEAKLLIGRGDAARGAVLLQTAIESLGSAQQSMHYAGFVPDIAEGIATTEDPSGAAAIVEAALTRAEQSGVQWHVPELLRVKGELLLRSPETPTTAPSEACFQSAMELALRQGALFWELRASLSLAHLRLQQGRERDGHRLLAPVYARFVEGFDTADLRSAKALLDGTSGTADR